MPERDDLISVTDAAEQAGVSRQTIWRWVQAGRLPVRRIGRVSLIERADLAAVVDGGAQP